MRNTQLWEVWMNQVGVQLFWLPFNCNWMWCWMLGRDSCRCLYPGRKSSWASRLLDKGLKFGTISILAVFRFVRFLLFPKPRILAVSCTLRMLRWLFPRISEGELLRCLGGCRMQSAGTMCTCLACWHVAIEVFRWKSDTGCWED